MYEAELDYPLLLREGSRYLLATSVLLTQHVKLASGAKKRCMNTLEVGRWEIVNA